LKKIRRVSVCNYNRIGKVNFATTKEKAKQALPLQINKRLWQQNYYEHVIRNEKSLYKIREYIKYNAEKDKIDLSEVDKLL